MSASPSALPSGDPSHDAPLTSPDNPRLADETSSLSWTELRARQAGLEACGLGVYLAIVAMLVDMAYGEFGLAFADLVIFVGCYASLVLTGRRPAHARFRWIPAVAGLWISLLPVELRSGFSMGPFFGGHLILLLLGAITVQTRFTPNQVLAFVMANLFVPAIVGTFWKITPHPINPAYVALHFSMTLAGIFILARSQLTNENTLIRESQDKTRKLSETEGHLSHAERMAEVGNLVATTAHELAQPIQVISASAALLVKMIPDDLSSLGAQAHLPSGASLKDMVARIDTACSRLRRLLSQLRDFSRKDSFRLQTLDINEIVRSVLLLTQHDLRVKGVSLDSRLPGLPVWVWGDHLRIQQVLFNLINNARDACAGTPNARIEVCVREYPNWVRIEVRNTGPGIPLPIQSRIFQPYVTTKDRGKGTGLGLSICAQLIDQHGGRIFFSSEADNTVFVVDLRKAVAPEIAAGLAANDPRAAETRPRDQNPPA